MLNRCLEQKLAGWQNLSANRQKELIDASRHSFFTSGGNGKYLAHIGLCLCLCFLVFVAVPLLLIDNFFIALVGICIAGITTNLLRIKLLCDRLAPLLEAELGLSVSSGS